MKKNVIIIIPCIVLLCIVGAAWVVNPPWFDLFIRPPRFVEIELEEVAFSYFEPSEHIHTVLGRHWFEITTPGAAENLAMRYGLILPDIDFEIEMFVVSMGSELEFLDYDLNEPTYRERGKYIGFPVFSRDRVYDLIVVYRADRVPITNAEGAGFITPYMGRGREDGSWGWS